MIFAFYGPEKELFARLRVACVEEDLASVQNILKLGKIDNLDRYTAQSTLLCIATRGWNFDIFKTLIAYGADPDARTEKGDSALICAARNGQIECLEYLLNNFNVDANKHSDVRNKSSRFGFVTWALERVLSKKSFEKAKIGLVDVNGRGHRAWTALHWASLNGRYEIAATLVAYGADIDCETEDGASCVFLACLSGHANLVEDMIKFGANIHTKDKVGDTPLHAAARQNGISTKSLLKAGAEYARNNAGQSPLDAALIRGHRKFVDILLLSRPELRETFYFNAIELACVVSNETRSFEKIFKVLSQRSQLDFIDFEKTIECLINKISELTSKILDNPHRIENVLNASKNTETGENTFEDTQQASTKGEQDENTSLSSSSVAIPPLAPTPTTSSQVSTVAYGEKYDGPEQAPISTFKFLANAFVNLTHDVLQTPKIRALIQCSNLKSKIGALMKPLDSVWEKLEKHILTSMNELSKAQKLAKSEEEMENAKKKALKELEDVPSMIDRYFTISRMMQPNSASTQTWASFIAHEEGEEEAMDSTSARDGQENGDSKNSAFSGFNPTFLAFIFRIHEALRFLITSDPDLLPSSFHFILDLPTNENCLSGLATPIPNFSDLIEKLSFEQKRSWLRVKIETEQTSAKTGSKIVSDRIAQPSDLLQTAKYVNSQTPEDLRGKLLVKFRDELGVGAGVQREWFQVLLQRLVSEEVGLFEIAADRTSYTPISAFKTAENAVNRTKSTSKTSSDFSDSNQSLTPSLPSHNWSNEEKQILFEFTGRLLAMALVHEENLFLRLSLPVYKSLLKRSYCFDDMKHIDEEVHRNMRWLIDTEGNCEDLGISFEAVARGTSMSVNLADSGEEVEVNESNKQEFIKRLTKFYFEDDFGGHLTALCKGFYGLVPHRYIAPFTESELELIISGQDDLDLGDWKENTKYSAELAEDSPVVVWFWQWMDSQTTEMHRKVLQFVTGSPNVPLGGFKNLRGTESKVKFNISKAQKERSSSHGLPTASTCFNMLKMPEFSSQQDFQTKMEIAVNQGYLGFSFY